MDERPLSILHLARAYWPMLGGGERLATEVSEGLARRGHRVRVLLIEGGEGAPSAMRAESMPPIAGRDGVELVHDPDWGRWDRRVDRLRSPWLPGRGELRQLLRRIQRHAFARLLRRHAADADVLLLSSAEPLSLSAPAALGARRPALMIATQAHLEETWWPDDLVRAVWPQADLLAVNTAHEAEQLVARYGVDPAACVVTGCGAPAAQPAPWPRAPVVLYLGRVDVRKRIPHLLAAMRLVWAERPDARLIVAGARGPSTAEVDVQIDLLPDAQRARVDAPRDIREDVKAQLLAGACCLVLPSIHESFGIVLSEAWSQGTPVIAMDTAVARDVVRPEVDGLLVEPLHPSALAGAIRRLLDDQALAQRLGAAGRTAFLARGTWDHVAARYEAAARLAVARRAARSAALSAGART